jgi:hypothetical protein
LRHAALPHSRDMAPQSPAPCPSARQGPAAEDERMRMLQPTLCLGRRQNTRLQTWQPPGAVPPNEKRFGVCECVCALVCVCVCMCVCTYTPLPGVPTFTPRWRWRGTRWRGRPAKTEGVHIHTYMWIIQQIPGACWQTHAHAPARPTANRPPCSAEDGKAPRVRGACEHHRARGTTGCRWRHSPTRRRWRPKCIGGCLPPAPSATPTTVTNSVARVRVLARSLACT